MGRTSDAKERLQEAAFDLIWTNSYASVGVDQICERAGVNKGSFYHFFPSKSDLALATFENQWRQRRPDFDAAFSPLVPPVERLDRWCGLLSRFQEAMAERFGKVCGCPLVNLGSELSTQDNRLRKKVAELFDIGQQYLLHALRDAIATGALPPLENAAAAARGLHAMALGFQVQAKVANDPKVMRGLRPAVHQYLGIASKVRA